MMTIKCAQPVRRVAARGVKSWCFSMLMLALSATALAASTPMDHSNMPGMDQGDQKSMKEMDKSSTPATKPDPKPMDHSNMPGMDPGSTKDMQKPGSQKPQGSTGGMEMGPMQGGKAPPDARDPDASAEGTRNRGLPGMDMADTRLIGFLLIDRLELSPRNDTLTFDSQAWFGGDYNKLWLKAEGDRTAGRLGATRTEALWDRAFATYWSSQLGIRHDFAGGPGRNWAAMGVQGLARYWFDVEATAYVGESGRTAARFEAEYDLLLTQRLILQPKMETNLYGTSDPGRNIGSGLSDMELGLRLRYEIKRQFAPYVGVSWQRKFGNTADFARAAGEDVRSTTFVAGVRLWF
jgi:copper resistance protein B